MKPKSKKIKLPRKRKKLYIKERGWVSYYAVTLGKRVVQEMGRDSVKNRRYYLFEQDESAFDGTVESAYVFKTLKRY